MKLWAKAPSHRWSEIGLTIAWVVLWVALGALLLAWRIGYGASTGLIATGVVDLAF